MLFNIAIVEDDKESATLLNSMIERFVLENPQNQFNVIVFDNGVKFLSEFKAKYDLIFLDVEMPKMNGIDVAKAIRNIDENVMLIFVTNMAQYAAESYEVHAYDYILKPVNYSKFLLKFKRITNNLSHNLAGQFLTISTRSGINRLAINDIVYVEVVNHQLIFHLENGEYTMNGTMNDIEQKLNVYHFVRCNVCYLVNLRYVKELKGDIISLSNGELKISRSRKSEFYTQFAKYVGGII